MMSFPLQNKMDVQEVNGFFENEGFILDKKKRKRETNDTNPEHFWSVIEDVKGICKLKSKHANWGAKSLFSLSLLVFYVTCNDISVIYVTKKIKEELNTMMGKTSIRKNIANFMYDEEKTLSAIEATR